MRRTFASLGLCAMALAAAPAALPAGAPVTIINGNAPGEGFNDPTSATPVGGNAGTTVGQQRLIAFQRAADIWAAELDNPVEIRVRATFEELDCDATSAVLGAASPTDAVMDFPNAPIGGTWYAAALANQLAGEDLNPTSDDMTARFNSRLGEAGCLDGSGWYYGLDADNGADVDLVAVLLHEFGHGLGFLTFVDESDGAEFFGSPDIFEMHILDTATNKHWDAMTNGERAGSAANTGSVTWDGAAVQSRVSSTLAGVPALSVTSPSSLAGDVEIGLAGFGTALSEGGLAAQLVQGLDAANPEGPTTTDGCSALTNAAAVAGKIALVDRGTCLFVEKGVVAQNAGAIALVIADNVAGTIPPGLGGDDPGITIPVVSITRADGDALEAALAGGVTASLRLNPRRRAGTGRGGRVLLYAPNPIEPGSSISHWNTSAVPNLLMEPNINDDLDHGVDLTLPLLRDIGWRTATLPPTAARQSVQDTDADKATRVTQRP